MAQFPSLSNASGIWSLKKQKRNQQAGNWPKLEGVDAQFNYVTMLLRGDGSMSGSDTVTPFNADASTNNFNVSINGDTKSNNFTPYQEGYYSNYFDGSGDYLTVPNNAALNVGSSAFTIECWFYNQQNRLSGAEAGVGTIFGKSDFNGSNTNGYTLFCYDGNNSTPSTNLRFFLNGVTFFVTTPAGAVPFNTWTHIAVVKSGTNLTIYCNGVSSVTSSSAPSTVNDTSTVFISGSQINGTTWNGTYPLAGYVSNLRLVKGTAVYTANFTPPTSPLTAITNTSLLTCQSNRFIDNSTNAFTITKAGDTAVSPAQPFTLPSSVATYGSGYFDGTGDYLSLTPTSALNLSTNNWTIEMWVNLNTVSATQVLINFGYEGSTQRSFILYLTSSNVLQFAYSTNGSNNTDTSLGASGITTGTWNHLAVVRNSTTITVYRNGVAYGTTITIGASAINYTPGAFRIGVDATNYTNGYITDCRLVNGTAVYTTTFTPPTAPLTAITNTSLLTTQYNGGGNNSGFKDSSQYNFPISRNGNTTQGTFTPYGSNWSNYFDGSGDYLTTASSSSFNIGTNSFCVEFWVYTSGFPTGGVAVGLVSASYNTNFHVLGWQTNIVRFYIVNSFVDSNAINLNAWNHIACVRNGTSAVVYINGVAGTAATLSGTGANSALYIGSSTHATSETFTGYLSNVRFVNGSAVYTSNFTPSTTPLTAITNTQLLTCQSNRFIDNSTNAFTITKVGDTSVQRFSPFSPTTAYSTSVIGGSGYFDGSGDYLSMSQTAVNSSTALTIEGWFYINSTATTQGLWGGGVDLYGINLQYQETSDQKLNLFIGTGSAWGSGYTSNTSLVPYTWYHIAYVRSGTTHWLYINGVVDSSINGVTASVTWSGSSFYVGVPMITTRYFNGYVSNLRVSNSVVYSGTFTPPTTPVTGGTLLLNYTNPAILDNAMMNNLETVGNATISTSVKKYGTGSLAFDGSGDYLSTVDNSSLDMGSANFTIEGWVYVSATSGSQQTFVAKGTGAGSQASYHIALNGSNWVYYLSGNGSTWSIASNVTIGTYTINTWQHIALVRNGSTFTPYLNGVAGTTTTSSTALFDSNKPVTVGADDAGTQFLTGYIDDLRITRGVARYVANFTPPITTLPNQ